MSLINCGIGQPMNTSDIISWTNHKGTTRFKLWVVLYLCKSTQVEHSSMWCHRSTFLSYILMYYSSWFYSQAKATTDQPLELFNSCTPQRRKDEGSSLWLVQSRLFQDWCKTDPAHSFSKPFPTVMSPFLSIQTAISDTWQWKDVRNNSYTLGNSSYLFGSYGSKPKGNQDCSKTEQRICTLCRSCLLKVEHWVTALFCPPTDILEGQASNSSKHL